MIKTEKDVKISEDHLNVIEKMLKETGTNFSDPVIEAIKERRFLIAAADEFIMTQGRIKIDGKKATFETKLTFPNSFCDTSEPKKALLVVFKGSIDNPTIITRVEKTF